MAAIDNTNIAMVRGDTLAFAVEIEDLDQDLDTCFFSCRNAIFGLGRKQLELSIRWLGNKNT